jgi:hypothetical protein
MKRLPFTDKKPSINQTELQEDSLFEPSKTVMDDFDSLKQSINEDGSLYVDP